MFQWVARCMQESTSDTLSRWDNFSYCWTDCSFQGNSGLQQDSLARLNIVPDCRWGPCHSIAPSLADRLIETSHIVSRLGVLDRRARELSSPHRRTRRIIIKSVGS